MITFNTVAELAQKAENVYIIGHVNPDGDCIGATIAFAMLLEKKGIGAKVLLSNVPDTYSYLPIQKWVTNKVDTPIDLLVVLDCGDMGRLGEFEEAAKQAKTIVNIDHHFSNPSFGHYNLVDADASSTSEMIFNIIDDEALLDEEIAKALYTGIIYDTGIFKHSCTTRRTHQVAGKLIQYGFAFSEIIDRLFFTKSLVGLKLQSKAIENIRTYSNEQIILSYLTEEEVNTLGASKKESEGIIQMLNEVEGVEVAAFLFPVGLDKYKVSLRSRGKVDVCKVAMAFGGGGHIKASGCTMDGPLDNAIESLIVTIMSSGI